MLLQVFQGRPIFFRQARVGYRGKPFRIWKFRTMVRDADKLGKPLTAGGDARVTRLGGWLRRTKLDELPQLFNVLIGDMSFVGPRPEVERYVDCYDTEQRKVLELTPGITDAASIRYRDEEQLLAGELDPEKVYISTIVPDKIRLNLEYASSANVIRDCVVILRTLAGLCWR
jgi:lipopolysaccharide/colanic/teichoic acid biosynthesis glycosyltransferase